MKPTVFVQAHVPDELQEKFMQYVRDFDAAHPGCHFEIAMVNESMTLPEMVKALQDVKPGFANVKGEKIGEGESAYDRLSFIIDGT